MPSPRLVFSPRYGPARGSGVGGKFPAKKFVLAAERLRGRLPFVEPEPPPRALLELAHDPDWAARVERAALTPEETEKVELEVDADVSLAHRLAVSGTLLAARDALERGVGLHAGGGAHHAFRGHGSGYCLLNDLACAGLALLKEGKLERFAVVDLDVHQGDGTAAILSGEPRAFTLSLHQADIFPEKKQKSTLDVELKAGTADAAYLEALRGALARVVLFEPQLVLYQAGVDCVFGDELGGLALTKDGLRKRDALVRDAFREKGTPVAVTLGGGYRRRVEETAELHAGTLEAFL